MPPPVRSADYREKLQSRLLKLGACIEMLAFPWAVIPRRWMEISHEWLGMGAMPEGTVVDFMIRQSAFFYGMHGVLLWWLARDVQRFQPIIRLIGVTYLLFGPVFFLIDWSTGTPVWWTACDPLVTGAFGVLLLWCSRGVGASGSHGQHQTDQRSNPSLDERRADAPALPQLVHHEQPR